VVVILKYCQYDAIVLVKGKGKGKIHAETGDEGPERERERERERESRSIALLFFKPQGLYGGGCHSFCTITDYNKRPPRSQA